MVEEGPRSEPQPSASSSKLAAIARSAILGSDPTEATRPRSVVASSATPGSDQKRPDQGLLWRAAPPRGLRPEESRGSRIPVDETTRRNSHPPSAVTLERPPTAQLRHHAGIGASCSSLTATSPQLAFDRRSTCETKTHSCLGHRDLREPSEPVGSRWKHHGNTSPPRLTRAPVR